MAQRTRIQPADAEMKFIVRKKYKKKKMAKELCSFSLSPLLHACNLWNKTKWKPAQICLQFMKPRNQPKWKQQEVSND